jgi:hypothetical protein
MLYVCGVVVYVAVGAEGMVFVGRVIPAPNKLTILLHKNL